VGVKNYSVTYHHKKEKEKTPNKGRSYRREIVHERKWKEHGLYHVTSKTTHRLGGKVSARKKTLWGLGECGDWGECGFPFLGGGTQKRCTGIRRGRSGG